MVLLGGPGEVCLEDADWGSSRKGTVCRHLSGHHPGPLGGAMETRSMCNVVPPLRLPFAGRSGKCILGWADCQLPSLQTVHPSCTLILVLEVKSKIQFNCAAVEPIQADGRRPLEGLTAQEPLFLLKAMTFGQRISQSQLQEEEVKGLLGSG